MICWYENMPAAAFMRQKVKCITLPLGLATNELLSIYLCLLRGHYLSAVRPIVDSALKRSGLEPHGVNACSLRTAAACGDLTCLSAVRSVVGSALMHSGLELHGMNACPLLLHPLLRCRLGSCRLVQDHVLYVGCSYLATEGVTLL